MVTEMKDTQEGIKSGLQNAEEWTGNIEDRVMESTQSEWQKEKKNKWG